MSRDDVNRRDQAQSAVPIRNDLIVYTAFFWVDSTHDITFQFASMDFAQTIDAACAQLASLDIVEPGYKEFLLERIAQWNGKDLHVTTTGDGSLVLMPTPLAVTRV